jgi:hypothetical protein
MPRQTKVIPAAHDFFPVYWNVAIYRPGTRSDAFQEDDDLWVRSEGLEPDEVELPAVGDRLVWGLPPDLKNELRLDVAMVRWGELDGALNTETLEELVITDAIAEPRTTREGDVYGVLHLFVASAAVDTRGGAQ